MADSSDFPTFAQFLSAITGYGPFPWQRRLAEHVEQEGRFPDAITVPTGLGKTTSMLVHLHALARDMHYNQPRERTVPLRCFHIVERRAVVDAAAKLADLAAEAINAATEPGSVLHVVRCALARLIPEEMVEFEPVVSAVSLHGGIHAGTEWLRPIGAQLITATVTQIASRALFNGVGVAQSTRPMHAAITGIDRVILVDEPHLSEAAIAALRDAEHVQSLALRGIGVPIGQTVLLGATAPTHLLAAPDTVLSCSTADERHRRAGPRLRAPKHIELVTVGGKGASGLAKLVSLMTEAAIEAHERDLKRAPADAGGEHGVLVFVNTVEMARKVHTALAKKLRDTKPRLVHGRMRRWERPVLALGRGDVTVTTQALEVGADIDGFEVITQLSSLSALIQRAGRCNRYGNLSASRVRVFSTEEVDAATKAVYGGRAAALLAALSTLSSDGPVPAAPADIEALREAAVAAVGADVLDPSIRTATLRPQVARYASYTDPGTDFPLEAFLSGPDARRNLDVTVAWRDSQALDLLPEIRVHNDETVQVPLPALLEILLLAGEGKTNSLGGVDDLDSGLANERTDANVKHASKKLNRAVLAQIRVRKGHTWNTPESVGDITPGAMVVLDTDLGGYTDAAHDAAPGLNVSSRAKVTDISAAVACARNSGRFLVTDTDLITLLTEDFALDSTGEQASAHATEALAADGRLQAANAIQVLPMTVRPADEERSQQFQFVVALGDDDSDPDTARCRTVLLSDHNHQVGRWSGHTAATLGLPTSEATAITEAGHRHDIGKAAAPFQKALGSRAATGQPAWAKSRRERTRAERHRMRTLAGLSPDWRHEVAGAAGIEDPLTRHLVVAHHMWGRPLIVHPDDHGGADFRITDHVETFDALSDTYGPWGLALLETVMRWADHRASAHPRTYGVDSLPVAGQPSTVSDHLRRPDPRHQLWLPGLTASPMAGVLAAVGLLDRIVTDELDPHAVLRFEPDTGIPVIGTSLDTRNKVEEMVHDTTPWKHLNDQLGALFDAELCVKNGRMTIPECFDMRAVDDAEELLHQLLPDTAALKIEKKTDGGTGVEVSLRHWQLRCIVFSNNGSAFNAALHEAPTQHFFDTRAGYTDPEKCKTGGLDIHPHSYPGPSVRRDTLAWALAGYRSLGWGAVHALESAKVVLPVPTRWTTVAGYRALTAAGGLAAKGPSRTWTRTPTRSSPKLLVWAPAEDSA